jgi:hypothetical protein
VGSSISNQLFLATGARVDGGLIFGRSIVRGAAIGLVSGAAVLIPNLDSPRALWSTVAARSSRHRDARLWVDGRRTRLWLQANGRSMVV